MSAISLSRPSFAANRDLLWKRPLDLSLTLIGLLAIWPVLAVVALAVWLSSPGPVFFIQTRIGRNGVPFGMIKFRSMYADAEARRAEVLAQSDRAGLCFKSRHDPRITPVGRVIRRLSLDELPQIFNVLRGEMSLVGPRAEWSRIVADYETKIPSYHLRHLVKPGITGWAQVNYRYGAGLDDAIEKLRYDLYYIKAYSLVLDIEILLKTILKVFSFGGK